jgi:hypothetical protein
VLAAVWDTEPTAVVAACDVAAAALVTVGEAVAEGGAGLGRDDARPPAPAWEGKQLMHSVAAATASVAGDAPLALVLRRVTASGNETPRA